MQDTGESGLLHKMYGGSGGNSSSSLPPQALPLHKKTPKWGEGCMDRLEEIGLQQMKYNSRFNELYSMVEGNLAYTDYEAPPDSLKNITDMMETAEIPSYVRHFDVLGQIANHLSGKYNDVKNKFRVDFLDPIATNEFNRELTNRLHKFSKDMFKLELDRTLIMNGVEIDRQFENPEEQQQYLQYIEEQKKNLATPPEIKAGMLKEWKPIAAKWAEMTLEQDTQRFNLAELDREFFLDKFLTGRFFKHYRVGYDYYKPERWSPETTFFSQDINIKYPQDGEYVGRIHYLSPSDIINIYGYMISEADQKKLLNAFDYKGGSSSGDEPSFEKMMKSNFVETEVTPGEDYYARETMVSLQNEFGQPLGEETYINSEGETVTRPAWIPSYHDQPNGGNYMFHNIRRDIDVRKDGIRVVEAYWRSFERIGVLYYENDSGILSKEIVTDEILEDFLKENNIKTLKKLSIAELEAKQSKGELEPNTICFTYAPRVYKGVKVCTSQAYLKKDLYLGVEPMPFQIKGDSNLYDVQLPVTGLITTSEAAKLRPYQIEYNYQMNLMHSLTEKEIGMFFLFDVNFLTSEFAEMGDSREALLSVIQMARDVGIVPIDASKQNLREKGGQQFNTMMAQDISFVPQIQMKMQMAEYYKRLMLEQIGVTAQDMGTPQEYMTAEGIKVGNQNSFNQIEHIFEKMDNARMKDLETNLTVAQYCQTAGKDTSINFTRSDGELQMLRNFFGEDEMFPLRKFGLLPVADSKKRKELEMFKNFLLQSNTFENDLKDYAEVITSDSMASVIKTLADAQVLKQDKEQQAREHEQQLMDKQLQAQAEEKQKDRDNENDQKEQDRQNKIDIETIQAYGRAIGRENTDQSDLDRLDKTKDRAQKRESDNAALALKEMVADKSDKIAKRKLELEEQKIQQDKEKMRLKEKEIDSKNFTSIINKN